MFNATFTENKIAEAALRAEAKTKGQHILISS